jgi:hypothetical protein
MMPRRTRSKTGKPPKALGGNGSRLDYGLKKHFAERKEKRVQAWFAPETKLDKEKGGVCSVPALK